MGLDTICDQQVGFPNLELTGPIRMKMGESSSLADPSPPMPEAHMSAMAMMSTALHEASLSQNEELGQHGELPRVVDITENGGFHAKKSPAPVIQVRNQSLVTTAGVGDCEIVVGQTETMGSLAEPSVIAKCTVSDGFSVEESSTILDKPDADLTHSMRTMMNPDGDYEKSTPQSETVGCLVESSVEV